MKLNGTNTIQGLFNHNTTPEGVIYTKGDIVYDNLVLYTCLSETTSRPNASLDEWELYLNNLGPVSSLEELNDSSNDSNLVSAKILKEYLQSSLPGLNSDGTLKVLAEGKLDELLKDSKFQLDPVYLQELYDEDPTSIPFQPFSDRVYIITTLGNFITSPSTLFHQEILEIQSNGTTQFWYRTGPSLKSSLWRTIDIAQNIESYKNYIDQVSSKALAKATLFEDLVNDFSNGNYKVWLPIEDFKITNDGSSDKMIFSRINVDHKNYNHYRIYFSITEGVNKYRTHVDITPNDHTFLSISESFFFKDIPGLELKKVQSQVTELIVPPSASVVGMVESKRYYS
jgi:hypothetical protein